MRPPIDISKLKQETKDFLTKPFDEDAQALALPMPRLAMISERDRPGFVVSSRKPKQIEESHDFPISARFRTSIHLFYDKKLKDNRFRYRFYKNRYGVEVTKIPAVRNFLENVGNWSVSENGRGDIVWLDVDIVGLIYIKANYP